MIAKGSLAAEQLKAFGFISKTITTPARILHLSYSDEFFSSVAAIIERYQVLSLLVVLPQKKRAF